VLRRVLLAASKQEDRIRAAIQDVPAAPWPPKGYGSLSKTRRLRDRPASACASCSPAQDTPLVATHDPRLIVIAGELARWTGRDADGFEF
jgi:hypothetical protein